MKHYWMFLIGIILCTNVRAQNYSNEVTLVQQDGDAVTVLATAVADKKKEAGLLATKSAFHTLFHSGIQGVKNGVPMIAVERPDYDYRFFTESRYINYIGSEVQTVKDAKIGGKYRVTVRLTIQLKTLCADLEHNQMVISSGWMDSKAVKATAAMNPTIVIVPDMTDGSDLETLRKKVLEDPTLKYAINKLADEFGRHGYTTQDAFVLLQNRINSAMMNLDTQSDLSTELLKGIPGDIVVNVDMQMYTENRQSECRLTLKAVEKQTGNILSTVPFPSGRYITTEYIKLVDYAIKQIKGDFFNTLQAKFEDIIRQGRTVVIDMNLSQTVTDWDFDQDSPATGDTFKDALTEWLEAHCHQSVPNMTLDTDKVIQVRMNIPLWNLGKNKAYTLSNFSSDLRKFFKAQFGDNYKANVKARGQGVNVTIE